MDDRAIVQMLWDRDENALGVAGKAYGAYCLTVARSIVCTPEDAEECVNDALMALWNSVPPHRPENLRTYLGKLVREISIDRWRADNRKKRIRPDVVCSLDEISEIVSGGDFAGEVEAADLSRAISEYLQSLDETKRNVFIRRYWHYDSVDDICRRYGFGRSRVLMMLKRTRDGLGEHLRKEGFLT